MSAKTHIQWTDATWNIARGCTKVDEDCKFCYMYRDSMDATRYNPLQVIRTKTVFNFPLKYKETKSKCWNGRPLIFTSSLTDVFHEAIDPYRDEMWKIIKQCPHLIFQILTKRPERIIDHLPADWGNDYKNVWFGTSVGSMTEKSMKRMEDLILAAETLVNSEYYNKIFLSLEPLHGPVTIPCDAHNFGYFDWVITGGESGNDRGKYTYRPCEISWLESIVEQCYYQHTPVFVKQMGTHLAKQLKLTDRHGGNIDEFPATLQIRQFPKP